MDAPKATEAPAAAAPAAGDTATPAPSAAEASATPIPAALAVPAANDTAPKPNDAAKIAEKAAPATVAPRKTPKAGADKSDAGGGGQLPLEIIIPGAAVIVIGGILALVMRRR